MADDYRQRCADAAMTAWGEQATMLCDHSQIIPIGAVVDAVLAERDNELRTAEAEVARLRAGETDEPTPEGTWPTPAQWIRSWNQGTPEQRLAMADQILRDAQAAHHCGMAHGLRAQLDQTTLDREEPDRG